MKKLFEMTAFFLANVIRKRTAYVYLGFMALLILRYVFYEDTPNFVMENRRADYFSWAHFFGSWLLIMLNISVFEEVLSRKNVDGLLSLGLTRAVIFGAAILSVMIMILVWTCSILALSTYAARPPWPLFLRDAVAYLLLAVQLMLIQAFTLLLLGKMPIASAAIAALGLYLAVGTIVPFFQEAPSIPAWILPLAHQLYFGISRYVDSGFFSTELVHALLGVGAWFGIAVYWSMRTFMSKDLNA
ncbi:MAG: hypothetical protein KGZ64_06005 [Thermaerobacter sp.]|nr:hypothetical protein [Thermaerobacter sp.]